VKPQNAKAHQLPFGERGAIARIAENVGAVAFSRTGDPAVGEFSDAVVLKAFGEVPDDLNVP
jgi:hypothetical protein